MNDVIIVGGGPAGSGLGCYLSLLGIKNTIIERAIHPRPHVGESMVTSTTRNFEDIGFLEVMEKEGFIHKYGASWHAPARKGVFDIQFREFPQAGVNQDYTYHVDRSKMDLLLLKHAESLGSKVYQGVHVKKVLFEGDQAVGVRAGLCGQEMDIPAKLVVDATGRHTLLGRQLKLLKPDPHFNQFAVHAWFEKVDCGQGERADDIHIYFLEIERGWAWQIPITETVTSVGIVADKKVFKASFEDVEKYFYGHIKSNPDCAAAMRNAKQVNEFKKEADYSYSMKKFVGDGYLCIGDAARFVDPIFSSGCSVALSSAKFASERIKYALDHNDFSAKALQPYEDKLRSGVNIWYEFITLYYKLLPLFTYFIQSKKHRLEVLQLLQGEVYDRQEVPVLDAMRKFIETVENSDSHIFKLNLTETPIDV